MAGNAIRAAQKQKNMMRCMDAEGIIAWQNVRSAGERKRNAIVLY